MHPANPTTLGLAKKWCWNITSSLAFGVEHGPGTHTSDPRTPGGPPGISTAARTATALKETKTPPPPPPGFFVRLRLPADGAAAAVAAITTRVSAPYAAVVLGPARM